MYLCKRWLRENAYSSLKSVERPINLYIILFDNHSPFQKSVFVHSKYILSMMYWTNMFKNMKNYFLQKNCIFVLECIYSFLPFNFVIWQVVCECINSLKHIPLTYFRSVP